MSRTTLRRLVATATLFVVITLSVPAAAAPRGGEPISPRERIIRIIKKLVNVVTLEDQLGPPKPSIWPTASSATRGVPTSWRS